MTRAGLWLAWMAIGWGGVLPRVRACEPPAAAPAVAVQDDPTSGGRYEFRDRHDPNGIGKFYMGREIARVMGFQGAIWLDRPEREDEEAPSKLVEALQIKPGQVVADVGCGSGLISMMLAQKAGATGKVYAVDVQPEMLELLDQRVQAAKLTNVIPVLGTVKSPKLPAGQVDLILMVDVYHEFEYPYEMLSELSRSLKVGGRIAFVEYRKEDPDVPIKLVHKMTEAQVRKEASVQGLNLRWKETLGMLPRQHIVLFERSAQVEGAAPPTPSRP